MSKSKLIFRITSLVFTIALLVSVTFAWYITTGSLNNASFEILKIDSKVTLYGATDSNYNGVPDLLSSENSNKYFNTELDRYVPYTVMYYSEKYDFTYLDQRYALAYDTESNLLNKIVINDILPTKVYTYKFEIINYSGSLNYVKLSFEEDKGENVTDFEARAGYVNGNGVPEFSSWTGLTAAGVTINDQITIAAKTTLIDKSEDYGRSDIWLEVREKATSTTKKTNYLLPTFNVTLSTVAFDEE